VAIACSGLALEVLEPLGGRVFATLLKERRLSFGSKGLFLLSSFAAAGADSRNDCRQGPKPAGVVERLKKSLLSRRSTEMVFRGSVSLLVRQHPISGGNSAFSPFVTVLVSN